MEEERGETSSVAIAEAQLVLAEKRTSLAVMRTGIAVLVLPMSVMSVLVATSRYYDVLNVLHLLIPLGLLNLVLTIFGAYLIIHSIIRMRHYDRMIREIKGNHRIIGRFIE
jgi:uncharacterized membrane protein YidH (DUF202 family)